MCSYIVEKTTQSLSQVNVTFRHRLAAEKNTLQIPTHCTLKVVTSTSLCKSLIQSRFEARSIVNTSSEMHLPPYIICFLTCIAALSLKVSLLRHPFPKSRLTHLAAMASTQPPTNSVSTFSECRHRSSRRCYTSRRHGQESRNVSPGFRIGGRCMHPHDCSSDSSMSRRLRGRRRYLRSHY